MTEASGRSSADPELAAALHILEAPLIAEHVQPFIGPGRAINFPAMLEARPWSTGEQVMICAACDMWGRDDLATATLSELAYTLDEDNLRRVVEALAIRRRLVL